MKKIFVLLVLLSVQTAKVCTQPYKGDSDGNCRNSTTEYLLENSNLCCKKCPPGQRLIQECSETADSVCKQCDEGQYMEAWNYAKNCFSCNKCKQAKGLQYAQKCSPTTRTTCICQPGTYCIMDFSDPYCKECKKYSGCKTGYGVSLAGTANSNVVCKQCPDGTFSATYSHTDPCRPHTTCHGRVVRKGNTTSDTVCESEAVKSVPLPNSTKGYHTYTVLTTTSTVRSTVLVMSDSTLSVEPSVSTEGLHRSANGLPSNSEVSYTKLATIVGVTAVILLVITVILVFLFKAVWKKDAARVDAKVDANGNCEKDHKHISQDYLGQTRLTSFTVNSAEQQCLLEKRVACSDYNQSSNSAETLTRADDSISHESSGPLQSTVAFNNSSFSLSEPMTLASNPETVTPLPCVPSQSSSQSSSQPTSPQIISPVTTSPHVNVNITFHIGNGTCGTPSIMPSDLTESDCNLPFGEEEESVSIPQQEDGKQSLISVQDSADHQDSPV